jgi:hypothetical protein
MFGFHRVRTTVQSLAALGLTGALETTQLDRAACCEAEHVTDTNSNRTSSSNWKHGYDSEGRIYYYNENSGESSWRLPLGFTFPSSSSTNVHLKPSTKTTKKTSKPTVKPTNRWDSSWDIRKNNKHQVVHQIVMVRHGQYEREGETDNDHKLTVLGKEQAEATGKESASSFLFLSLLNHSDVVITAQLFHV